MVKDQTQYASRVSRRDFFKVAGIGAAGATIGVSVTANAQEYGWDEETDVVVVGSGAAALAGAVGALENGAEVAIFEKGPIPGGTTAKSGGVFWIPNNAYMRENGIEDPREDAIKYIVRVGYPHLYRAEHETLGIPKITYDLVAALYDEGSRVIDILSETGALEWVGNPGITDYMAHMPENKVDYGRSLRPTNMEGNAGFGADITRQLITFVQAGGAPVRLEHAVTKIVLDDDRRVIGVEVDTPDGPLSVRARKGVVFGSGGFTHNLEMRENYLRFPVMGGCAVPTNQGDLVNMAIEIGAKLGNMNEVWLTQEVLEQILQFSSVPTNAFVLGGDSMIVVNKHGQRTHDEKHLYNERTRSHGVWDGNAGEYVNLHQFMVFDDHAIEYGGGLMPPPGADLPPHIIAADSWGELAVAIEERLETLSDKLGDFRLGPNFLANLEQTVARFDSYAETGVDLEFGRGELPISKGLGGAPAANNNLANRTLYPFSDTGPYYCIILTAGTLDSRGGPVTNTSAQVLDVKDQPIAGLYAAGNCAASPSGQGYCGPGGTLGPALTLGYIAGEHAATQG